MSSLYNNKKDFINKQFEIVEIGFRMFCIRLLGTDKKFWISAEYEAELLIEED